MTRDGWNLLAGAEEWVAPVHAQVGPDGAVWVVGLVQLHRPAQPDAAPGFSNGAGNAYETSMRDESRGRIYRVVYRDAPPRDEAVAVEERTRRAWWRRCRPTTCCGGCTRSGCSSSAARRTSCRSWSRWSATRRSTRSASTAAALHALWTLHGLGELAER